MNFDYVALFGGVMMLAGIASFGRSIKMGGWKRVRGIISSVFFVFIGFGMIRPVFQTEQQREVLNLEANAINKLTVYDERSLKEPLVQLDNRELLSKWANILRTCTYHRPSHPLYETTYTVEVEYHTDKLLYKLNLDSRDPNTVDLEPYKLGTFLSIPAEFVLGTYRCNGLFDFLMKALQ